MTWMMWLGLALAGDAVHDGVAAQVRMAQEGEHLRLVVDVTRAQGSEVLRCDPSSLPQLVDAQLVWKRGRAKLSGGEWTCDASALEGGPSAIWFTFAEARLAMPEKLAKNGGRVTLEGSVRLDGAEDAPVYEVAASELEIQPAP